MPQLQRSNVRVRHARIFLFTALGCLALGVGAPVCATTVFSPVVEFGLDPGQRADGRLKVYNESDAPITLESRVVAFTATSADGSPRLPVVDAPYQRWFTVDQPRITLESKQLRVVPFTVSVPQNATPGGYAVVVYWRSMADGGAPGQAVGVSGEVGTVVLLQVSGEAQTTATLSELNTVSLQSFLTGLPVQLQFRVTNTGNTHVRPIGTLTVRSWFGKTYRQSINQAGRIILPGDNRQFTAQVGVMPAGSFVRRWLDTLWQEVRLLPIGRHTATVELAYADAPTPPLSATIVFWIWPVHLLGLCLLVISIVIAGCRFERRIKRLSSPHA